MTTKQLPIVFALSIIAVLVCTLAASTAIAGPDFEEAADLSPLEKIYGDGDALHEPGLPDAGTLRVYWFWSATSQCSTKAEPAIEALQAAFDDVEVIVVHSNADETVEQAQKGLSERNLKATVYRDVDARLAIALDARITPEVIVADDQGLVYRGNPVRVGRRNMESYIEDVASAWSAGEDVQRQQRRPVGCVIRRP